MRMRIHIYIILCALQCLSIVCLGYHQPNKGPLNNTLAVLHGDGSHMNVYFVSLLSQTVPTKRIQPPPYFTAASMNAAQLPNTSLLLITHQFIDHHNVLN
eukprot:346388_1